MTEISASFSTKDILPGRSPVGCTSKERDLGFCASVNRELRDSTAFSNNRYSSFESVHHSLLEGEENGPFREVSDCELYFYPSLFLSLLLSTVRELLKIITSASFPQVSRCQIDGARFKYLFSSSFAYFVI